MPIQLIPNLQSTSTNNTQSPNMNLQRNKSFAAITRSNNQSFPNKNQAIVLNTIEEIPLEEYLYSIGDIVGPTNITHAYKLSNDRFCIWLTKKEVADKLVDENRFIKIQEHTIEIRRYINPAIRVLISYVCASVPHSVIENAFTELNIKLSSPIRYLRTNFVKEGYQHILGSRRQVYVAPDCENQIPNTLKIFHDETEYRIFLSCPDMICRTCGVKGHSAKYCPSNTTEVPSTQPRQLINYDEINVSTPQSNRSQTINETPETRNLVSMEVLTQNQMVLDTAANFQTEACSSKTNKIPQIFSQFNNTQTSQTSLDEPIKSKRAAQAISSADEDPINDPLDLEFEINVVENKKDCNLTIKPKKAKKSERPETPLSQKIEEIPTVIQDEIAKNPKLYILSFPQYILFFEKIKKTNEYLKTVREFTENISGLLLALSEIHTQIVDSSLKNRIKRIINRIKEQLIEEQKSTP